MSSAVTDRAESDEIVHCIVSTLGDRDSMVNRQTSVCSASATPIVVASENDSPSLLPQRARERLPSRSLPGAPASPMRQRGDHGPALADLQHLSHQVGSPQGLTARGFLRRGFSVRGESARQRGLDATFYGLCPVWHKESGHPRPSGNLGGAFFHRRGGGVKAGPPRGTSTFAWRCCPRGRYGDGLARSGRPAHNGW